MVVLLMCNLKGMIVAAMKYLVSDGRPATCKETQALRIFDTFHDEDAVSEPVLLFLGEYSIA